jgi:hypothetical protein
MRLSLVSGTAFVDFSAADTLTPYLNGKLTLTDSAGKKAIGYIKAAGTGETLDSELITSWVTDTPTYETFTTSGTDISSAINDAGANGFAKTNTLGLTDGKLYTFAYNLTLNSGTAPGNYTYDGIVSGLKFAVLSSGENTRKFTANSFDISYNRVYLLNSNTATNYALTTSLKQVLTPSATGVTITSTPGGATYNWASIESGFNYNDASGYTYNISLSNEVLYEDNNILILNFKDCPVTNATQILVDVSDYNCNKLSIEKIWHSISGIATATLFDATTDDTAIILVGNDVWTFDTEFPNPKSTGFTGDLNMTISSAAAGDSYNIILRLRKY